MANLSQDLLLRLDWKSRDPVQWLLTGSLKDLVVYSRDMVKLGKVKDFDLEPTEMKVTSVVVQFEKGAAKHVMGKKIVIRHATGKVPPSLIESLKDACILKLPWNDLKDSIESL